MTGSSSAVPATPSIISADLKIIGNMQSNGDIQIDGQVDGDVQSKSLTVGESAQVNGTIACERVRVCGSVSGEIKADSVVLARSAKVDGDIVHKTLEIEAGAGRRAGQEGRQAGQRFQDFRRQGRRFGEQRKQRSRRGALSGRPRTLPEPRAGDPSGSPVAIRTPGSPGESRGLAATFLTFS
jgi:cytoskeletal protein CcmA (bactofilin family)